MLLWEMCLPSCNFRSVYSMIQGNIGVTVWIMIVFFIYAQCFSELYYFREFLVLPTLVKAYILKLFGKTKQKRK